MSVTLKFNKAQIAPCGMNCGCCIAFLRDKNRCFGCRVNQADKVKTRVNCIVKNCTLLKQTSSKFCFDCETFPCQRMKSLDKRYRTKYSTSLINNLEIIKESGIRHFLRFESERRTCPECGSILSVHKQNCLQCDYSWS
ncbi:MAG: DUF3795 domain-containing protein [Bacteroidota bacterium]|nr:DUF3795 domain-containing protein [Bacteroidota bacterium]